MQYPGTVDELIPNTAHETATCHNPMMHNPTLNNMTLYAFAKITEKQFFVDINILTDILFVAQLCSNAVICLKDCVGYDIWPSCTVPCLPQHIVSFLQHQVRIPSPPVFVCSMNVPDHFTPTFRLVTSHMQIQTTFCAKKKKKAQESLQYPTYLSDQTSNRLKNEPVCCLCLSILPKPITCTTAPEPCLWAWLGYAGL